MRRYCKDQRTHNKPLEDLGIFCVAPRKLKLWHNRYHILRPASDIQKMRKSYLALAVLVIIQLFVHVEPAVADTLRSDFYTDSRIYFYDNRDGRSFCSAGSTTTATGDADQQAKAIYDEQIAPKLSQFAKAYEDAGKAEGFPNWQLLAGIHYMETTMSAANPTTNLDFRGVFQQSAATLSENGIDSTGGIYASGAVLTTDDITKQARDAIKFFLKAKAQVLGIDASKPLQLNDLAKLSIAYKSGQGSPWLIGQADPNLHAYTWAGFDTSDAHKLAMHYGPTPKEWGPGHAVNKQGEPIGDERTDIAINRPGALTVWKLFTGSTAGTGNCSGGNTSTTGFAWPISPASASVLTGCFGDLRETYIHDATDFATDEGIDVVAIADGEVVVMNKNDNSIPAATPNWHLVIKHADGSLAGYEHMLNWNKQNGQELQLHESVKQGQLIGHVGNRGNSTGPHLHLTYVPPNLASQSMAAGGFTYFGKYAYNILKLLKVPAGVVDVGGCSTPEKLNRSEPANP